MARYGENWTRDELILAFALYSEIPFGKIHMGNPKVQELARFVGPTPGSVSMKLSNFARLDPALQARGIVGLQRGAKGEKEIWDDTYRRILDRIQNTRCISNRETNPKR